MQKNPSPAVTCTSGTRHRGHALTGMEYFSASTMLGHQWFSWLKVYCLFYIIYIAISLNALEVGIPATYSIRFYTDKTYLTRKGWLLGVIKTKSAYWLERGLEYSCEFQIMLWCYSDGTREAVQLDLSSTVVYGDDWNNCLSVKLESSECSVPQICLLRAAYIFDHGYRCYSRSIPHTCTDNILQPLTSIKISNQTTSYSPQASLISQLVWSWCTGWHGG